MPRLAFYLIKRKLFGHYYAATEMPQIIEYDPITLETIGKIDLEPVIPGISQRKYSNNDNYKLVI